MIVTKSKKQNKAMATIELLIAFAILLINITGVIMIIQGGQYISIDSQTSQEALRKAEKQIEEQRIKAKNYFLSIDSIAPTRDEDPLYIKEFSVVDLAPCKKQVSSKISWSTPPNRPQNINLATIFTDIAGVISLGGDCDPGISDNFDNPNILLAKDINGLASSIDVINNRMYITSNKFPPSENKDFFVYDFDPDSVNMTSVAELDLGEGLNDVDVAGDYAFVASASTVGQLQVINLSTMTKIQGATRKLPETTTATGQKIFYYRNKAYIGTQYLACPPSCPPSQNNEFHIYDVSVPSNPIWLGSVNINHNVNDIFVSGDFAYLATSDNDHELMIININPESPDYLKHPDDTGLGYNAPGNNDGSSVYVLGNKVYLGRKQNTVSSSDDFFVLNKHDVLDNTSTTDGFLNSKDLNIGKNALVSGIMTRSNLAFITLDNPGSGFVILDTTTMMPPSPCASLNFSENNTGIDMDNNFIFIVSKSSQAIKIIHDQTNACS